MGYGLCEWLRLQCYNTQSWYINGLGQQACSNSNALPMEILWCCVKSSISCVDCNHWWINKKIKGKINNFFLQILELLWDLSHLPSLPTSLMEQALDEHLAILLDNDGTVKEQVKRTYVSKCINDIKEVGGEFVSRAWFKHIFISQSENSLTRA